MLSLARARLSIRPSPALHRHFSHSPRVCSTPTPTPTPTPMRRPPPPPPLANPLVDPPPDAYRSPTASVPIRKPADHVPAVQRWSAVLPDELVVGTFGVQSLNADEIAEGPFMRWARSALAPSSSPSSSSAASTASSAATDGSRSSHGSPSSPDAPITADHARHTDAAGYTHHVVVAYWPSPASYARWAEAHEGWWSDPARDKEDGIYREVVNVPRDRAETIYWLDYPGGLMRDPRTQLYPTPYCGYYGAMRDRLACAADDPLEPASGSELGSASGSGSELGGIVRHTDRTGRWRVTLPRNTAVIRSSHTWEYMDDEQFADYGRKLKPPLARGMDFLATQAESGCLSLRWNIGAEPDGTERPEAHATAYFVSLGHMEAWAERHRTHAAIFGAAVARYKHYGGENQLRTWHEVFVLPENQTFEYINCHPETGLLPYFEGEKVR